MLTYAVYRDQTSVLATLLANGVHFPPDTPEWTSCGQAQVDLTTKRTTKKEHELIVTPNGNPLLELNVIQLATLTRNPTMLHLLLSDENCVARFLNARSNEIDGNAALHMAAKEGLFREAKQLIKAGARK